MKNLILIGGGGHAKACLDVVLTTKIFNVIGYIDIKKSNLKTLPTKKHHIYYPSQTMNTPT